MDIALIYLVQAVASPDTSMSFVAQSYLILNTTGLLGLSFWLGVQWNKLQSNTRELVELKGQLQGHVVPVAQMKTTVDNIKEDVEKLTKSFDELNRSIFIQAIQSSSLRGRRHSTDDADIEN